MRYLRVLIAASTLAIPTVAAAETFRLTAPDGTVHFTNAPTDPRYARAGMAPARPPVPIIFAPQTSVALDGHIRSAATRYGLPERLVSAVIRVESGFNPRAVSPKGAMGLMQLMPTTASILGVRDSFDPLENIDGGVRHLRGLMDRFGNNVPLVLAAYNAGEGAVAQYRGIPPYPETQQYVARILRLIGDDASPTTAPLTPAPLPTYRVLAEDGTTTYTNIPPRGRR